MIVIDQLGLRQDPFGPANGATGFGVAAPLLRTHEWLLAAVRRGDPLTVLAGRPGMGKTLLLGMIEQACRADGIEVRAVARGDMAHTALGSGAQLLLIDEADTINAATLKALAPGTADAAAPVMVFAAAQPALHRISGDVRTTIIDLRPLEPKEAREFLLARAVQAGRPDLFTPEALDIIIDAGRGSPRLLRVLAGAAMFQAVSDGVAQISADHASLAAAMQGSLFGRPAAGAPLPVPANDLGPRVDAEDRPRVLVSPSARPLSRGRAGALAVAASVALTALVIPVFFLPEPSNAPSMGVPSANAAQALSGAAQAAAPFTVAAAEAAAPLPPLRSAAGAEATLRRASLTVPPLVAARTAKIAVAAIDTRAPSLRPAVLSLVAEALPVTHAVRPDVVAGGERALLIDLLAATRLRPAVVESRASEGGQGPATEDRSGAMAQPATALVAATLPAFDEPPPVMMASLGRVPTAEPFFVRAASVTESPATAKDVARPSNEGRSATEAVEAVKLTAAAAKQGADETRTTKLAAQQAKEAADQAKAAKEAADQAAAAKQTAKQAQAAKDTADQAKSAKDAADRAKAAKEAAEQAKAAKRASEQAKAAKVAADQAKAAKDAADQAKATKDAADQAKAAKVAADQAKAAKEAAEQAKAAKDAADQAKAAKEAAEQAKAAKDAADQAKAAKDAADQAKAAKDAADQAKAAKDAADQAKAAKDAADQAKAAKDAVDQAKAAKDAADQAKAAKDAAAQVKAAKEAADAAKEAVKAAKDAAKAGKGN